ncbi:hypothetical protein GCM10009696_20790 [Kocuria himachalensis]
MPLLLELSGRPGSHPFKKARVSYGIAFNSFEVEGVHSGYERLDALGVRFLQGPTAMSPVTTAVLDHTCGTVIWVAQMNDSANAGH